MTTLGEASKAPRNSQDGWPYEWTDNLKTKEIERSTSKETIGMPHTAITTQGQLHALEEDTTPRAGTKCLSKTPVIEASPKKKLGQKKNKQPYCQSHSKQKRIGAQIDQLGVPDVAPLQLPNGQAPRTKTHLEITNEKLQICKEHRANS